MSEIVQQAGGNEGGGGENVPRVTVELEVAGSTNILTGDPRQGGSDWSFRGGTLGFPDSVLEDRIAALEARATKQSADNNAALGEVATLKEQIAALDNQFLSEIDIRQVLEDAIDLQRSVNEALEASINPRDPHPNAIRLLAALREALKS